MCSPLDYNVCHACTQFEALLTLGMLQSLPIDLHEYCSTQYTSTGANTCNEAHKNGHVCRS